jgi:hypothetical protein
MTTRAERMADEMAGRMLARLSAANKAAGLGIALPSCAELAATVLPVCEAVLSFRDDVAAFRGATEEGMPGHPGMLHKNAKWAYPDVMRKNAKLLRRNERLMKALATPASEVPVWARGAAKPPRRFGPEGPAGG